MQTIYENEFVPRLKAPTKDDKWYCQSWSPCIDGEPQAWAGSVLANCVGYAFGRFAEIGNMSAEECKLGKVAGVGYPQSASVWWNNRTKMGYEFGSKAKLGACGCWINDNGNVGHVRIVEKINADGSVLFSESSWGGKAFNTCTLRGDLSYYGGDGKKRYFQGFIYNPAVLPLQYPQPVERDEKKTQYNVTIDDLWWRKGSSKSADKYPKFVAKGIYDVIESKEDGGYMWHKVAEQFWFAGAYNGVDTHGEYYPAQSEEEKLRKRIAELEKANSALASEVVQLNERITKAVAILQPK